MGWVGLDQNKNVFKVVSFDLLLIEKKEWVSTIIYEPLPLPGHTINSLMFKAKCTKNAVS